MEFTHRSAAALSAPVTSLTPSEAVLGREMGGFDFSLSLRNSAIAAASGGKMPKTKKTGTTICGIVYKDGIVLGADTRATEGSIISDKNCEKIHYIAPNIYCCGAGTAADTESITALISSNLELLRLSTGAPSRVVTAMTMLKRRLFQHQGHISAALVLGGVDVTGPHLYTIYPHGSTDKLPFVSMGSGSLAAMAVLESGFKDDLSEEEGVELVKAAIRAGIFNDLGSGSNVDVCVIKAGPEPGSPPEIKYLRNIEKPNEVKELRDRIIRPSARFIPRGSTVVLKERYEKAGSAAAAAASAAEGVVVTDGGMDVDASAGGGAGVGSVASRVERIALHP